MTRTPSEVSNLSNPLHSLRLQIKRTEAELIARQSSTSGENGDEMAVLFTGNWHDSVPRRLVLDASMTPTERLLWMIIRLTIGDASKPGSVPRRGELARLAGCSNTTITTSREVLRVNRWITHCRTVRSKGRFVGDIYLLHDEPLSLASTLELDPNYIEFLERLVNGASKTTRVRQLAANILREIDAMNAPVVPPTETEVMSGRLMHWVFGVSKSGVVIDEPAHQEQNLTPVKAPAATQVNLFSDLGKTNRLAKRSKPHQEQILTSAPIDQKTLQEQILTPVDSRPVQGGNFVNSGNFLADFSQGEKLTPVVDPESDQGEFLTPVVFSSLGFSSSSLNNKKNITGRAREEADQTIKNPPNGLQRADISGAFGAVAASKSQPEPAWAPQEPSPKLAGRPENPPEQSWDQDFAEEPTLPDLMCLSNLITRHLPDISNPCLSDYTRILLATRQPQIPQLARILRPLPKNMRRNVLFQLLGKAASDWHGWSARPMGNLVGYSKTLADLAGNDQLKLDDFAIELMRAADANRKPYFESTVDRDAEIRQMDRAAKGAMEGMS